MTQLVESPPMIIAGVVGSVFLGIAYLFLFRHNRNARSFLFFGIALFLVSIYLLLTIAGYEFTNDALLIAISLSFAIAVSRAITVESGYYKYFRVSVLWYEPLLFRKTPLRKLQPLSSRKGRFLGILFILLSLVPVLSGRNMPNLLLFLSGAGVMYYSMRYPGKELE